MKKKVFLRATNYNYDFSLREYPLSVVGEIFNEKGESIHKRVSSDNNWLKYDLRNDKDLSDYEVIDEIDETFKILKEKWILNNKDLIKRHALSKLSYLERELLGI